MKSRIGNINRKLKQLDKPEQAAPAYVSITPEQAESGELPDGLPLKWRGKVYVGVSPDDWSETDESEN